MRLPVKVAEQQENTGKPASGKGFELKKKSL
jgi:hypothetical protein